MCAQVQDAFTPFQSRMQPFLADWQFSAIIRGAFRLDRLSRPANGGRSRLGSGANSSPCSLGGNLVTTRLASVSAAAFVGAVARLLIRIV